MWDCQEVVLPINNNRTVDLPPDYIQWIRIGNFNNKGELQILNVNNQLSTFGDLSSDRLGKIASQVGQLQPFFLNNPFFENTYVNDTAPSSDIVSYGLGSRLITVGDCKVDAKNRVILFNPEFPLGQIILQYISAPEQNDDFEIPLAFQEAMISWLNWQDKKNIPASSRGGAYDKQAAAADFKNQLLLARKLYKPFRIAEAELYFRQAERFVVKG